MRGGYQDADIDALKALAPQLTDSDLARKIVNEDLARGQAKQARKRPTREPRRNLPRPHQKRA